MNPMAPRRREKTRGGKRKEGKENRTEKIDQRVERAYPARRVYTYTTVVKHNFSPCSSRFGTQRTVPDNLDKPKIIVRIVVSIVSRRPMPINRNSLDRARRANTAAVKFGNAGRLHSITYSEQRSSTVRNTVSDENWEKKKKSPFRLS